MTNPFAYDTVRLTARPPRPLVAYERGQAWTTAAMGTLRWLSSVWGGAAGAVLPLSDANGAAPADRRLLAAARAFDPDVIVHRPVLASDVDDDALRPHVDPATADRTIALIRETQPDMPIDGRPHGWESVLLRWLSAKQPYVELDGTNENQYFPTVHEGDPPPEPFTSAASVAGRNVRSAEFVVDDLHPLLALMVVTRSGFSPVGRSAAPVVPGDDDLHGLAEWATTGTVTPGRLPCVDVLVGAPDAGKIRAETILEAMPLPATTIGVGWLTPARHRYAPSVFVVGDAAEDHALAVLADRTVNTSAWVPATLLADRSAAGDAVRYAAAVFLQRPRPANTRRRVLATSTSLDLDDVASLLDGVGGRLDGVELVSAAEVRFEYQKVLADPAAASRRSTHPVAFQNGTVTLLTAVDPPVPSALEGSDVGTWMVDVSPGSAAVPPARATLPSPVMLGPDDTALPYPETLVRSSRHGMTFWSQRQGLVLSGALPGTSYARPQLRFPGAADTVAALASAAGMMARLSVVGQRALSVADMWGAMGALAEDLRGPVRALLRVLAQSGENGATPWGCVVDRRNHVTFEGATKLLGTHAAAARSTLDRLLVAGAVRRGLVLGCGRCSSVGFYRTAAVTDTFTCSRCFHANDLTQERWRSPAGEPNWFYDLDPLVGGFLDQNGDVPLVAADAVIEAHGEPGSSTFETEFWRDGEPGSWMEVDFACLSVGRLYLGEAKSNGSLTGKRRLRDTAQRMATLAVAVSVDHVVLATSTPEWQEGHVEAVRRAVREEADHHGAPEPTVEAISVSLPTAPTSDSGEHSADDDGVTGNDTDAP